jgi:hypothetical protein
MFLLHADIRGSQPLSHGGSVCTESDRRTETVESDATFEAMLRETQAGTEAAVKSAGSVTRELRKAKAAAVTGQVRELRRSLDAAISQASELLSAAREARAAFDLDEVEYLGSGDYAKELLALAAERGVSMYEEDERLLSYPSIVRVIPGDAAIEIDRRRERRLRPSVLLDLLAAVQQRPARFRADQFLQSLASGYDLVAAQGGKKPDAVVRLTDIWSVLTLLPGQAKDYTRPEFARDLYLLDQSNTRQTKDGRALRWHASSGTRTAGVLTTVARTGQQQLYWAVSFTSGSRQ